MANCPKVLTECGVKISRVVSVLVLSCLFMGLAKTSAEDLDLKEPSARKSYTHGVLIG